MTDKTITMYSTEHLGHLSMCGVETKDMFNTIKIPGILHEIEKKHREDNND
jgi:hypothetical protein